MGLTCRVAYIGFTCTVVYNGLFCGVVLIKLFDVGRPSPLWAQPFPRQGVLNYVSGETKLHTNMQVSLTHPFPPLLLFKSPQP